MKILSEVMRRFARHGLKLSINKCAINCDTIIHLGFKFEPEGISLTESRVDTITNYACPTDAKAVMRFIGLCIYIRRHIPHLQMHLKPLQESVNVFNKSGDFVWGPTQTLAFNNLKAIIVKNIRLAYVPSCKPNGPIL